MSKKLIKFQIILDRDSLLYLPGQVLSGRVLLETQENTAVMGLYFHVLGECTVHFAKGARPDKSYDKESYIDFRMKLLDDFEHKPILLSPGVHCFPFKLGLPVSLPSTFLGKHGWIQYYCKASLQETSGIAHKNQQVFIVLNPIDLNLEEPMLSDPVEASVSHRVGVGYLGGTIRCNVGLDKRAYVPGENILLTGEIYNKSNVAIKSLKYALIEVRVASLNWVNQSQTHSPYATASSNDKWYLLLPQSFYCRQFSTLHTESCCSKRDESWPQSYVIESNQAAEMCSRMDILRFLRSHPPI
ncbi:arrestin domain-containing protein 2-like isoform X2 [Toxorhynchites rutilus septentrionalis]|uniref:arrestin domain-containing protein 2-like isoform X2 n=1 Tax=Toxorhynchites rutilus septentrionalis TaxID=329112 RepID=UPI00247A8B56|nr:arrestin domain-containing protein 2-like isoform X2 [Toxorhynchites rutilus septentrionalis]